MNYLDADSQDKFHKSANSLLQVICQIFETYMYDHGYQVTVIDAEPDFALLGVNGIPDEVATDVADRMNKQFKRRDGAATCVYHAKTDGVFKLCCRNAADLNQIH